MGLEIEHDRECSVEGCKNKHCCKGYCQKHYLRLKKYGDPLKGGPFKNKEHNGKCSVEKCEGTHYGLGYCYKHYARFRRFGDPLITKHREKCSINECDGKHHSDGLCKWHYLRSDFKKAVAQRRRSKEKNAPLNDFTALDWEKTLKFFGNKCAYCWCQDKKIHREHVVPLSKGGSNTITNVIPACESCNCSKSDTLFEVWYPKQPFFTKRKEMKIYRWMEYRVDQTNIQATLF
jgi:hypothetical protein